MRIANPFNNHFSVVVFIFLLPLAYYPKLTSGDTQLWPLIGACILLLFHKSSIRVSKFDVILISVVFLAFLTALSRSNSAPEAIRFLYILAVFTALWITIPRISSTAIDQGAKLTIVLWFVVGAFQYISLKTGFEIWGFGRYNINRSGVPSLAPEPSVHGSISVILGVYLVSSGRRVNNFYYFLVAGSVFLSGSLLALMLLICSTLVKKSGALFVIAAGLLVLMVFLLSDYNIPLANRIQAIALKGGLMDILKSDYSINVRLGHIVYTCLVSFPEALFRTPTEFSSSYNNWAANSGVFYQTKSEYILSSLGQMIYKFGIFGLVIFIYILIISVYKIKSVYDIFFKMFFVAICILNPISFSTIYVMIYILQEKCKKGSAA